MFYMKYKVQDIFIYEIKIVKNMFHIKKHKVQNNLFVKFKIVIEMFHMKHSMGI